ncbi:hypothetical protein Smp_176140 [Schistosoma mansoni]|uniref:YpzI family protein n=1 Tax=Schistosoma mansoni TaxID=6183 RepID=G4M1H4_SCHMA|nr:hypothetical protein Smp_176140 [Schistosoma mansoni]|eukprot:XP_018647328.1 hypothetical protein Smp_176140 [Schistosoma mansoni]
MEGLIIEQSSEYMGENQILQEVQHGQRKDLEVHKNQNGLTRPSKKEYSNK